VTHSAGVMRVASTKTAFLPWALLATILLALLYVIVSRPPTSPGPPLVRASLDMAPNQVITGYLNISDDGRFVAVEGSVDGVEMILVRDLSEERFRALPNSDGGERPFFSPDASQVLFLSGGGLAQVPMAGGPPTILDPDARWASGAWAPDGTVYYPRSYVSGIWRKAPDGAPEMVTQPDSTELAHWHPQVMPDGHHLLFTAFRTPTDSASIAVLDLESGERRTVLRGAVDGHYVPTGHLLFARANTIFAVAFDPATMETTGQPVALIEDVRIAYEDGMAFFAVSRNGMAAYVRASEYDAPSDLVWIDRTGNVTPVGPEAAAWAAPSLSPDGRSIAVGLTRPGESSDVWVLDLARGTRSPLTVGGGGDFQPIWSPDGAWIIYSSENPTFDLFRRRADGSAPREPLVQERFDSYAFSFTPDGARLLFESAVLPASRIKTVALDGSGSIDTVLALTTEAVHAPALSPDGRLLAFTSEVSGHQEVYVAAWPGMSSRQAVSLNGGTEPRWTKGGHELVFRRGNDFLALSVDPETAELGAPNVLFTAPAAQTDLARRTYDVTADGARFITVVRPPERAPRRVMLITDFFEVIDRMVPNG